MKIKNQLRQGDVLLHPIKELPKDALLDNPIGDIILAEGEVTGHAHRIRKWKNKVESFRLNDSRYLRVLKPVPIDHEEHGTHDITTKVLQPGLYEVRLQTEVWLDEVRQVAD